MRARANRQLPLNFSGTLKLTQEWYDLYGKIHGIIEENPKIVDLVHADIIEGVQKLKRNEDGITSESILRLAIVQQIEVLSMRDLIVRVDDSQMLRFFCRFYDEPMISHSIYGTLVNRIKPETWKQLNDLLVSFARDKKGYEGRKLRLDTTAVETDVHYPLDSTLLEDGVRVLARLLRRVRKLEVQVVGTGRLREDKVRKWTQQLVRGGRQMHKATRKSLYTHLVKATEHVLAWAGEVRRKIEARGGKCLVDLELQELGKEIARYEPLVKKCVWQARERVLAEREVPNGEKIFSIFEPHTELLIRGKAGKELEFGHMVELRQIEGGLITHYQAHEKRPAEPALLEQAVAEHRDLFGRVPDVCATDKGYYSAAAVAWVKEQGVEELCVPKKGRRNEEEEEREHSKWFKLGQAFRAGIEGTISALKRAFGLSRCLREGFERFESWVGSGILAYNLVLLARG